jgi:hypothetical protein
VLRARSVALQRSRPRSRTPTVSTEGRFIPRFLSSRWPGSNRPRRAYHARAPPGAPHRRVQERPDRTVMPWPPAPEAWTATPDGPGKPAPDASTGGVEPPTSGFGGRRPVHLGHVEMIGEVCFMNPLEAVTGASQWKRLLESALLGDLPRHHSLTDAYPRSESNGQPAAS